MPPPTPPLRAPAGFLNRALSPSRNPIPRLPNLYTSGQASSASTPSASLRSAQAPTAQQTTSAAFTRPIAQQTARMSTMPATGGHSEACCNIPPVVASGYKAQGSYEQIGGFKTYVTGPADATKAILVIFDIFGFFDQTVQGADILATSDKHQKYKVYMPDWFNGEPCPIEWFPPNTEEKQKNLGNFFKKFPPPSVAEKVPAFVKAANEHNSSIKSWGILGYCWGGKVVSLATSGDKTPFSIAAEIHPAMVDANDASSIKVPLIMLASKDEAPEDVKKFESNLTVAKHVETFSDQIHGWMAARSDLTDDRVKEEYIRGYKTVLEFFGKQWN